MAQTLPEALQGEYRLNFTIDLPTFFEWMDGVMTKTGIANIAGMNRDLVNYYANGRRKPGQKQLFKIETALHKLGHDLPGCSTVNFRRCFFLFAISRGQENYF